MKVCDGSLYRECFNINPANVNADYLTDSVSFRKYIGEWDDDHEIYGYSCKGDSVKIEKWRENNEGLYWQTNSNGGKYLIGDTMKVIETKSYNLLELKNKKVFE